MMKSAYFILVAALLLGLGIHLPAFPADLVKPVVLFDQGHGQAFVIEKRGDLHLSGLAGLFREAGFTVKTGRQAITPQVLSGVDGLVLSGPFVLYTAAEIETVRKFVERGGRLSIMIHITPAVNNLLKAFGVDSTTGPVNEVVNVLGGGGKDFSVTRLGPHPITKGLTRFSAYGVWGLRPERSSAKIIAASSPKSWVDLNKDGRLNPRDAVQEFGIIVAGTLGKGEFAIFGDDAIFQNRFLRDGNLQLGKNLAGWMREMVSGNLSI